MTPAPDPGLCSRCRHVREVTNRRGSVFFLCTRSDEDPRFPRYPVLPVLRCRGFQESGAGDTGDGEGRRDGGEA